MHDLESRPEGQCPRCGTALTSATCPRCLAGLLLGGADENEGNDGLPPADVPLRQLGDYDLLEEIARGGMGVVYRARQRSLHREVAVKVMRDRALAGTGDLRRFHAEAKAAARLKHPHIVTVHEIGEVDGQAYFAMDLIAGGNLAERTREGPLPPRMAAEMVVQIADAVQHAHEQGVLHRDLKPSNVLLDSAGRTCVTDFGLARPLDTDSSLTLTGQVLGTPGYMPPEQAAGRGDVGPAADIYALGAVLYHLLTGRAPFAGASVSETLRQVLEQEPVSPRLLNAQVPVDLASVCLKCLAKDPTRRYRSGSALGADLQRFLNGEPTLARPAGPTERVVRWVRRKPTLAGAVLVAAVLAVLGFAGITWQWQRAEQARQRAEVSALEARRQVYATDMLSLQHALDQENVGRATDQLLVYEPRPGQPDFRGWEWWYFAGHCLRWIEAHAGTLTGKASENSAGTHSTLSPQFPASSVPVFASDERTIAFADDQGVVSLWDIPTRQVRAQVPAGMNPLGFSDTSGTLIAADVPKPLPLEPGTFGGLSFWDTKTGTRQRAWSPDSTNESISAACLSHDGRWLATGDPSGHVRLRSVLDGTVQREWQSGTKHVWNLVFSPDNSVLAVAMEDRAKLCWIDSDRTMDLWGTGTAIAFSPDGKGIATGFFRQVRVYAVETGALLHDFFTDPLFWLAFAKDGQTLACANGSVELWNVSTERRLAVLLPHSEAEFVRFSPQGGTLVGGKRRAMHVWETATEGEVERLFNSSIPSFAAPLPARDPSRVPPRDPATPRNLIDLSGYYHAALADSWGGSPNDQEENSLAELKPGTHVLAGVSFDVRGIIQLGSLHGYPRRVSGIPVGLACRNLHFLHASSWAVDRPGTLVGKYVVHYASGVSEEIPLVLGRDLGDWTVGRNSTPRPPLTAAWTGSNASSRGRNHKNLLYLMTWRNPHPDRVVRSLDFVWASAQTEPFLVAVTAE